MEAIKTLNSTHGQAIGAILPQTMQIFTPLLLSNKELIKSISPNTISYGSHPRQILDIFTPPSTTSSNPPILIFLHGGGLIRGDKNLSMIPENLVYANVGAFFAERGFTTLVMNYRRVNSEAPGGAKMGEDAAFPSGGEDVSAVLSWAEKELEREVKGKRDVFLMGNSAGGVHASTFILGTKFQEQRKELVNGEKGVVLKGLINVAVPTHFKRAGEDRKDVLKLYYGDEKDIEESCPYGLLEAIKKSGKTREEKGVPPCLAILGIFDPEDEIGEPMHDFVKLWKGMGKSWEDSIELLMAEEHNHISPPMALCSGEGEKWAEDVVAWMKKQCS